VRTAAASDFEGNDAALRRRWNHHSNRAVGVEWLQDKEVRLVFGVPGEGNMGQGGWREG
jgi:hypothetical protein